MVDIQKEIKFSKSDTLSSWKIEVDDFYNSILKSKACYPNIKDVYENIKIINKIYKNDNYKKSAQN